MVQYLSSFATRTITVLTAEVGTTLTISAPASTIQGQPFLIEGVLKRVDTNAPLDGENIVLSYNGVNLGTALTRDIEGSIKYQAQVQIDDVGEYTLRAEFAGSTRPGLTLGPSNASKGLGVSLLQVPVVQILASTVLGIGLVMLSFRK